MRERPALKPLVLVVKDFLAMRNLDKPYLGGALYMSIYRYYAIRSLVGNAQAPGAQATGEHIYIYMYTHIYVHTHTHRVNPILSLIS